MESDSLNKNTLKNSSVRFKGRSLKNLKAVSIPLINFFLRGLCIKALILLLALPLFSLAHFDLLAGASLRSYPSLGAELEIEGGYNQILWGEGPGASDNIMYGLARPSLSLLSSGVINGVNAKFELFPVSFIGMAMGREEIQSDYDEFTYFDCQLTRCKGSIKRDYIQFKSALSAGPLIASGQIEMARNAYSEGKDSDSRPGEYRYIVLANPKSDTHYRSVYFLGLKTEAGTLGAFTDYIVFEESDQYSKMDLLMFNKRFFKKLSATAGAGAFESSLVARSFIGVLYFTYYFAPSSKLF